MAKARKAVPCPKEPKCCLLEGHNDSCVIWKGVPIEGQGWDIHLIGSGGEVVRTLELTEEPNDEQVRAAAVFLLDPGKLPGRLMQKLPELRGTVYGDQTP